MDDKNSEKIGHECLRARVGKRGGGGNSAENTSFLSATVTAIEKSQLFNSNCLLSSADVLKLRN